MNIYTFKFSKKLAVAAVLALALIIALIVILVPGKRADVASGVSGMTTKEDLKEYIESLGYEVNDSVWESREVVIPRVFDDVYTKYNDMQKDCGFDLSKYKGKTVALHTFGIKDYDGNEGVLCDLLVYKKKIIGGAVYTADINGFMHGLKPKE
ncbi:MAG: DUF4830 domain-containing protein [Clostridia bacterium]|nr:DUF4830 domain-containing protein [Clostridia bacterium]